MFLLEVSANSTAFKPRKPVWTTLNPLFFFFFFFFFIVFPSTNLTQLLCMRTNRCVTLTPLQPDPFLIFFSRGRTNQPGAPGAGRGWETENTWPIPRGLTAIKAQETQSSTGPRANQRFNRAADELSLFKEKPAAAPPSHWLYHFL